MKEEKALNNKSNFFNVSNYMPLPRRAASMMNYLICLYMYFIFIVFHFVPHKLEFMSPLTLSPLLWIMIWFFIKFSASVGYAIMLKGRLETFYQSYLTPSFSLLEYPENNVENKQVNSKRTFAYSTCGFSN